jgi:hypothetical protein
MQKICNAMGLQEKEFLAERLIRLHIEAGEKIKAAPPGRKGTWGVHSCSGSPHTPSSENSNTPKGNHRPNGLGKHGVALCRGTPLISRFDIAWLATTTRACCGSWTNLRTAPHVRTWAYPTLLPTRGLACRLAFPLHRGAAQQKRHSSS